MVDRHKPTHAVYPKQFWAIVDAQMRPWPSASDTLHMQPAPRPVPVPPPRSRCPLLDRMVAALVSERGSETAASATTPTDANVAPPLGEGLGGLGLTTDAEALEREHQAS